MKKILIALTILLAFVMCACTISYAASSAEIESANALYNLGLFKGTGVKADGSPEYNLDSKSTRAEAVTMLVRLLGKAEEAVNGEWETPFNDVPNWAKPYVGYAYNKGLTKGVSETSFGGSQQVSEAQYLTFVLRALGYDDVNGDFSWSTSKNLSNELGITRGGVDPKFLRGDMAEISFFALDTKLKNSQSRLIDSLYSTKAVSTTELPKVERDINSEDGAIIYLPEYARDGVSYKELAKAYCGDENLYYTVNPKTDAEHWNNIKYALLTGKWEYKKVLITDKNKGNYKWTSYTDSTHHYTKFEGQYFECLIDAALLSQYSGGTYRQFFFYQNGSYYFGTGGTDLSKLVTPQEYKRQIIEGYLLAKNQYDALRAEGKIKDNSTEYEKAKAWSDWLCSVEIDNGGGEPPKDMDPRDFYPGGIALYEILATAKGNCTARASAFSVFMNMEGIKNYDLPNGALTSSQRTGHLVPWLLLDGKEYIFEYNSHLGLIPVDKANCASEEVRGGVHYFQEYCYNMILKRAGLPYDTSFESKNWSVRSSGEAIPYNNAVKSDTRENRRL